MLRECLDRGVDRGILLTDRRAAASDTLATSYILAQAVKAIGKYDIVFAGRQAIDGDTAQVGPQCAEKLGITQITYLDELVSLTDRTIRIQRNTGHGWEIVEVELPILVTVMGTANKPRPPAARRMMRFKRAQVESEVAAEVKAELADLRGAKNGKTAFAVRSTALSEDSIQASFAGEFETVLDVRTDEMVQEAIHTVRRSRHSERVRVGQP